MNEKEVLEERLNNYFNIEEKLTPEFPKNMLLEVTNICNNNCVFCANSKMTRKKSYIDEKFVNRILKEAYDLGTREIGFYSTGEPLVNKNLEKYIKKAKDIGFEYTYITTNGALLDKERIKSLINSGIDSIKFSINAGTKESYCFIHGKDEFNKVVNNLRNLFNYRKENNLKFKIFVSCILTRYTENEKEIAVSKLGKYSDDIVFLNCKNQCGVMYEINNYLISENKYEDMQNICPLPFKKLHITCEGYLTACCADFQNYLVVADLNNEKLNDSWNGEILMELRKMHIEHNLKGNLCYNCINNTNIEIKPLRDDLSVKYDVKTFDKTEEIIERIEKLNKRFF